MISGVVTIAAVVFGPKVSASTGIADFSIVLDVTNDNVLPLVKLRYACKAVSIDAPRIHFANSTFEGTEPPRTLWPQSSMTARCESRPAINITGEAGGFKHADYELQLHYYSPPWPLERSKTYDFHGLLDRNGRLVKWVYD